MQGETLQIVSQGDIPDVFTQPFHNLRLNLSKTFGEEMNNKISLSFTNILDDKIESFYMNHIQHKFLSNECYTVFKSN